jgi:hypothetical protein
MIHKHTFFETQKVVKTKRDEQNLDSFPIRSIDGVEVICIDCGQVRRAFSDGKVSIEIQGNSLIEPQE